MSKQSVLTALESISVAQANTLSLDTSGTDDNRMVCVKTVDGEGFGGDLVDIVNSYYELSPSDREWVISSFYIGNQQAVGGRPQCPIC